MIKLNELNRQSGMSTRLSVKIANYIMKNKNEPVFIVANKRHMSVEVLRMVNDYLLLHNQEMNLQKVRPMSYDTYINECQTHPTDVMVFFDEPDWLNRNQEMNNLNFLNTLSVSGFIEYKVVNDPWETGGLKIMVTDVNPVFRYLVDILYGNNNWFPRMEYIRMPLNDYEIARNKSFFTVIKHLMKLYNTDMEYLEFGELKLFDILGINGGQAVLLKRNFEGGTSDDIITRVGKMVNGTGTRICLIKGNHEIFLRDSDLCKLVWLNK